MAASKCSFIVFSRKHKPDRSFNLYLNNQLIPQVQHVKFLGLIFDPKLTWSRHIDYVINKCNRLKPLFYLLTKAKSGPSLSALITFYKTLVRSHIDFALPVYGSASKSLLSKLDVIQNQFLRLILGSTKSTPVAELHLETGIEPIHFRAQWLASKYIVKLGQHPSHPNFPFVVNQWSNNKPTRPRSSPCLNAAINFLKEENPLLFPTISLQQNLKPWLPPNFDSSYLPLSKKSATLTSGEANSLFLSFFHALPSDSIAAFTDGSLSQQHSRAAAAFLIPLLNVNCSWTLTLGSSILSAELSAIDAALLYLYRNNHRTHSIYIFSDSQSAIAVLNYDPSSHPIASSIINTIELLKQIGTNVHIMWIPSHVGITYNEQVDYLARSENDHPTLIHNNPLSLLEKMNIIKRKYQSTILTNIKRTPSFQIVHRNTIGPSPWLCHPSRKISIALHRLRTGHNNLRSHRSRFDVDCSPFCRFGCKVKENAQHLLMNCSFLSKYRDKTMRVFSQSQLPFNLETLLGLNSVIPIDYQISIRNALVTFLLNTKLIDCI